ncbi:MAG: phosphatase PAP2 family protein [Gemmatimonadaceae bacterium]
MRARDTIPVQWTLAVRSLSRPYPVSASMVALLSLVPVYLLIANGVSHRTLHSPALALDRVLPLRPTWALVYGAFYLFLIALPVFVVRRDEHIRRTFLAYLAVWITAYVCFLTYPTIAPRPDKVIGSGFATWGLRFLYEADPPYNCFPSLHVAHSFVSALTCYPVHRKVGVSATIAAFLVALSTLYTKQHYVIDVGAGVLLACIAYSVFLRGYRREQTPARDQHLAPVFAVGTLAISAIAVASFWIAYVVSAR